MRPVGTFAIERTLPEALAPLREVAHNLWWSWDAEATSLFERVHPDLWELTNHNPVQVLDRVDSSRLAALARDADFLAQLGRVVERLDAYVAAEQTWMAGAAGAGAPLVAYFSAEFAVTECLKIYSGGLGVLAGDHLKSASDLGVPLVGVGLLYKKGYFEQRIDGEGRQREEYVPRSFDELPLTLERRSDGTPVTVSVAMPGRRVQMQIWRAQVGRVPLYLLDTNVSHNWAEDREITGQLYGGDIEMRIRQEIVLGIGGMRALEALGVRPTVFHMNEGHSAFLGLERIRRLMEEHGAGFAEAREAASSGLVFTTHTPVEAGHDYFPPALMDRYFRHFADSLGLSFDAFLALGRKDDATPETAFCMTVLALRLAARANGVSELHGAVSRRMWRGLWPGLTEEETPIGHVTNGVHLPSWLGADMARAAAPAYAAAAAGPVEATREAVAAVADDAVWEAHRAHKRRLVAHVRRALEHQRRRQGAGAQEVEAASRILDPDALTIGFARRFATYKRATLLLRDRERLRRLVGDAERPVQFVFAGKAHPRDELGKELIRQIHELAREAPFESRVVFLEGYDPAIARLMVQGVDIWLNNPRRPLEASGTSGMKAAANGVLNLSVLDGWWAEAWDQAGSEKAIGWAIGSEEEFDDPEEQDRRDAESLYSLLERDVVPLYYAADHAGWVARMKESIARLAPVFNTDRMVREYTERYYLPAGAQAGRVAGDDLALARSLAQWKARVGQAWPGVAFRAVEAAHPRQLPYGGKLLVRASVELAGLDPDQLRADLVVGPIGTTGEITGASVTRMRPVFQGDGTVVFEAEFEPEPHDGLQGYTVRLVPVHPDLVAPVPGLVTWAEPSAETAVEAAD